MVFFVKVQQGLLKVYVVMDFYVFLYIDNVFGRAGFLGPNKTEKSTWAMQITQITISDLM